MDTREVLAERGSKYGEFADNSRIYCQIMNMILFSPAMSLGKMPETAQHALGCMATKLSRLLSGDPMYADNWRDLAGYATLMADICDKK